MKAILEKNAAFLKAIQTPKPFNHKTFTIAQSIIDEIEFATEVAAEDCHFIKIDELGYENEMPKREALENVISAMNNASFNFVYLLAGGSSGVSLYLGVVRDYQKINVGRLHAYDYGELLRESFLGNFHGSSVTEFTSGTKLQKEILQVLQRSKRGSVITGIPSVNEVSEGKELYTQKLDGLVNSMGGVVGNWQVLIVCDAMSLKDKNSLKSKLYSIYDELHLSSKSTVQKSVGNNSSNSVSVGSGSNKSENTGTNSSDSTGTNKTNQGQKTSNGSNLGHSKGISSGISKGSSTSENKSKSEGTSTGESTSIEHIDKEYQSVLKYMDEELFERINIGLVKGLFQTSIFALAENTLTHHRLVSNLTAMWQGDSSSFSPLRSIEFPNGIDTQLQSVIAHFQSIRTKNIIGQDLALILGHQSTNDSVDLRTCLTSRELSLICALPRKEIPGLPLREAVDFGLNPNVVTGIDSINLGNVIHQGTELKHQSFGINKEMLSRHVFIAGVTGSGKTTTCRRLLTESNLPFIIIEPAKTEYRSLLNEIDDMQVFTLGNENYAPFRFNPFELLPGESLTSHIDLLKASFTAAFPMEAAMPYLLEEAIYECYKDYGWNTDGWLEIEDANIYCKDPWNASGRYWPTLNDLLKNVDRVVKSKNFDSRLESDYTASLVARFKNLTVGSKGQMLNCKVSTDLNQLLDKKVVFELDDLKSPEDKCLMMGLIIARLSEAIKLRFISQPSYKHITLIEEAHRLLEKPSPSDDGSRKHAVGMFTDLLAEVRKYGESLVIVDQIPNKLTPEVLKNTNTKIIHKLFARDDREVIGDTVGLDEAQKGFLTDLRIGEVIVYSGDWKKAIHAKISPAATDDQKTDAELISLVSVKGRQQMVISQRQYFPELNNTNLDLDESLLLTYKNNKNRFWSMLFTVIEHGIRQSSCTSSSGNLKQAVMTEIAKQIGMVGTSISDCDASRTLLLEDTLNRLPLNLLTSESDIYQRLVRDVFLGRSKTNVENQFEKNKDELKDLLNLLY